MFVSRAMASIASVAAVGLFLLQNKNRQWPVSTIAGAALVIVPVLISGLWSQQTGLWFRALEVRVPLLTIGLGLGGITISKKTWVLLVAILLAATLAGSLYTILKFVGNQQQILNGYLQARVMPTPLDDDHIRFSWLVVLVILLCCQWLTQVTGRFHKSIIIVALVWLVVYLHLLAAKTGLLCLYLAAGYGITYLIFKKKKTSIGLLLLLAVTVVPFLCYVTMPSLQNRVQYVMYDFGNYSRGNFEPGSSDGARVLSLKAGWYLLQKNPISGVGFGDLQASLDAWHQTFQPSTPAYERFLPLNQWILYGAASGWPGILLFTAGIWLLLKTTLRGNILSRISGMVLLVPLLTDDTLERQFGVLIFIFVCMLWLQHQKPQPD